MGISSIGAVKMPKNDWAILPLDVLPILIRFWQIPSLHTNKIDESHLFLEKVPPYAT